jgi:hypothetical protein
MMQLLDQVHSGQQQLLQLWQVKRVRLDQCLQLRMFEQDCEKVITFYSTFFYKINFSLYFVMKYPVQL